MLRFTAWLKQYLATSSTVRYAGASAAAGIALALVSLLLHCSVRDPVALIYLAAIAVSF